MIELVTVEVIKMLCFLYCNHMIQIHLLYSNILECVGPMTPKVVQSTVQDSRYPASSVFILGEPDGNLVNSGSDNGKNNYWLAQIRNPNGQGFTVRVDYCARTIAGLRMKNSRNRHGCATDEFRVSASLNEEGPWETVVDSRLPGTTHEAPTLSAGKSYNFPRGRNL